ncbi:metal ABC transporter permease, partial [Acinetobacter baumannii]
MAGLGIVAMTGPLGCFILWRRMVCLGDTLAHAALLGVAIALICNFNLILTVFLFCVGIAFMMTWLQQRVRLAVDTSLGLI